MGNIRYMPLIKKSNLSLLFIHTKKNKKEYYPEKESICVHETCSEIRLQSLLDHTALRLYTYLSEVVDMCLRRRFVIEMGPLAINT